MGVIAMMSKVGLQQERIRLDVIVDEQQDIPTGHAEACVPGCRGAWFSLYGKLQVPKRTGFLVEEAGRIVRRVVVDDDDFVMVPGQGLAFDMVEGSSQKARTIQRGYDYRYLEHGAA